MELSIGLLIVVVSIFMYLVFIKNNEYLKIINNYATRIKGLELEIHNLKKIIETLNISLVKKESEFTLFSSIKYDYPFPFWIKDSKGVYMFINDGYEKAFSVSRSNFVGKTDWEIYPADLAKIYTSSDVETNNDPKSYKIFLEEFEDWIIIKWNHKVGNTIIANYGCCFPKEKHV